MQREERKWGVATSIYTALVTYAATDYKANPTLASGDATRSLDGVAFSNLATLPDAQPDGSRALRIQLSAAEMEASTVVIQLVDQTSPKEWEDQIIIVETQKARGLLVGKVVDDIGNTALEFHTTLDAVYGLPADALINSWICFVSGFQVGQSRKITGYISGTITVDQAFGDEPLADEVFEIVNGG